MSDSSRPRTRGATSDSTGIHSTFHPQSGAADFYKKFKPMLGNLSAKAKERKERGVILSYCPQTRAFPVLWTLEEPAVEYELKIVNLKQGEQKKDEYRRL